MNNVFKMINIFSILNLGFSQVILAGSQRDSHNCVLDGGYQWCEHTQSCIRSWETTCTKEVTNVDFCETSNVQTCRMACQEPICPSEQCAMRIGNCCDYTCIVPLEGGVQCSECPPPTPCPMPAVSMNCQVVQPVVDNCGCTSGCPTIDCSSNALHNVVGEGETCGGFMPYDMVGHCDEGLECVYNMGPMIADAPGICMEQCMTVRDDWGNCVDVDCNSWYDGCNTCDLNNGVLENCSENACYMRPTEEAHCMDNIDPNQPFIPKDCLTWYDGCNTCSVNDGLLEACTMMYCFTTNDPHCETFSRGSKLVQGSICYRFCEDNSQSMIDRSDLCPEGTECVSSDPSLVSFDSCGDRAHRCVPTNSGH